LISTTLTLTACQQRALHQHLFPDDGCEAVAIALCSRRSGAARHRLLVRRIAAVPYSACSVRLPDRVTWSTAILLPILEEAAKHGWALVKIHGHRGYDQFSSVDDTSDRALFPSIYAWLDAGASESPPPHASVILMDDGRLFGRVVTPDAEFVPLEAVSVVGDDLAFWRPTKPDGGPVPEFGLRVAQTFGAGTFEQLRKLKIAVVGCSGTGSPVVEQLARNGVGSLVLVDPDVVEDKNLNRILNATRKDAAERHRKVNVAKRSIKAMGLGTEVEIHAKSLFDPDVVRAIADCDVVFGCMDTIDGRYLLNKLATFYLLPYLDLGVKIEADGHGGVDQVCGSVHYLQPGGSSLVSRHVFSLDQVRAAGMQRTDPEAYRRQLQEGYIRGAQEDRPAVIQLNSLIASLAVNELLARIHPFRIDPNSDYAVTRVSLSHGIFEHQRDGTPCPVLSPQLGRGDTRPLLDWPELHET
jgi:hypothetical protein